MSNPAEEPAPPPPPILSAGLLGSLLADPPALPLHAAAQALADFGRTVVVAPHPDDETLGCGGLVALLRRAAGPGAVRVIVLTDGTGSHPGSRRFPAAARRALRERETLAALTQLGVASDRAVTFLGLADGALPGEPGSVHFAETAAALAIRLRELGAETVLTPWRRDPHPDHRATFQLVAAAVSALAADLGGRPVRLLEYPVWLWERAAAGDAPAVGEARAWRLDIASVLATKLAAVREHRSQTTDLIDDDPTGFRLAPSMLAHFAQPWEVFIEGAPPSA